jgi:hypothetical protein
MGAWVRGGEPPDEIKVTFVVNAKKDPELAAWLWGLPYRGTSASVRDILSAAARRLRLQPPATGPADVSQEPPASVAATPASPPPPVQQTAALAPYSVDQEALGMTDAAGQEGMTDAVARLMREMDAEF